MKQKERERKKKWGKKKRKRGLCCVFTDVAAIFLFGALIKEKKVNNEIFDGHTVVESKQDEETKKKKNSFSVTTHVCHA